ncbi:reverse transcriptase domain-containing protein [Tanacetum coccineum]
MSSQAPTRHIDVTESLLSPAHGSSPLPDIEDPYAQVMRAYETDSTLLFLYHCVAAHRTTPIQITPNIQPPSATTHDTSRMSVRPQDSPPHQRVWRISDILPEEEPKEDPEEDPDEEPAPAKKLRILLQIQSSRAVQLHEPDGIRWRDIECNIRPTVGTRSLAPSLVPNSPAAPAAPAPDVPTEAEDKDDVDVIEQIRARLKMHASVIDLHSDQLDDLAMSRFDEYERDVSRLNTRTVLEEACCRPRARRERASTPEMAPKRKSTRNTRPQPSATTAPVSAAAASPVVNQVMLDPLVNERVAAALAAASTTNADTSRPIGNNNRGCTYKEFCSCMTGGFNRTEGAVGLSRWLEKLETVFKICNCEDEARVKYASFTLQDAALTWWNNHLKSAGIDKAYAMPWGHFKEMVLQRYCPRNEVQKLESEFWNLKVKGTNLTVYNQRFQELA